MRGLLALIMAMVTGKKPTALSEGELRDPEKTINQKASQTKCLVSILPFLIGNKIPRNDDMWKLYLLLRDIIDLVFADVCAVSDSVYLKCKIEDPHSLFRVVFPDRNMIPKHHIYYGSLSAWDHCRDAPVLF
jgi:hypothetical protein